MLKAFARTNEIITSLMLNYVAGLLLTYLIFDSHSPGATVPSRRGRSRREGSCPTPVLAVRDRLGVVVPFGFCSASWSPSALVLFPRTRFGFELKVIGDSPRAARYAGMRTRRKILAVMALSGAIAGLGGASQVGDFSHVLDADPQGLQRRGFGYTGIVVAALARYNPIAVVLVAVLLGGLQNAGSTLQGPTSRPASSACSRGSSSSAHSAASC